MNPHANEDLPLRRLRSRPNGHPHLLGTASGWIPNPHGVLQRQQSSPSLNGGCEQVMVNAEVKSSRPPPVGARPGKDTF